MNDVWEFKRTRPNINYRYLIIPTAPVANGLDMLRFDHSITVPMIELGKKDAANAVAFGEGVSFELFEQYMNLSKEEKKNISLNEYFSKFYNAP